LAHAKEVFSAPATDTSAAALCWVARWNMSGSTKLTGAANMVYTRPPPMGASTQHTPPPPPLPPAVHTGVGA